MSILQFRILIFDFCCPFETIYIFFLQLYYIFTIDINLNEFFQPLIMLQSQAGLISTLDWFRKHVFGVMHA